MSRYTATCSSSSGTLAWVRYRYSVRNSPMPVAPIAQAARASATLLMFANNSNRSPSAVTAGCSRFAASWSFRWKNSRSSFRNADAVSGGGLTSTWPSRPSTTTVSPVLICRSTPSTPHTAGIPRLRATIAAWLVWLPPCVTIPRTSMSPNATACDGNSSSATTIRLPASGLNCGFSTSVRWALTRVTTSRMSLMRSLR